MTNVVICWESFLWRDKKGWVCILYVSLPRNWTFFCCWWQGAVTKKILQNFHLFALGMCVVFVFVFCVQCFFPVTTKSARCTPPVNFFHGHFWLFTGILSKIVTGKHKNFTVIFSKKVTGKLEISRSIRKKVVTGILKFVTGTSMLWAQNLWFTALITKVILGIACRKYYSF